MEGTLWGGRCDFCGVGVFCHASSPVYAHTGRHQRKIGDRRERDPFPTAVKIKVYSTNVLVSR